MRRDVKWLAAIAACALVGAGLLAAQALAKNSAGLGADGTATTGSTDTTTTTSTQSHVWGESEFLLPGKGNLNYVQVYLTGRNVTMMHVYLIGFFDKVSKTEEVSSKYLRFVPSKSSPYQVTDGTIYWTRRHIKSNSDRHRINIYVRVNRSIPPRKKNCLRIKVEAIGPGWNESLTDPPNGGYCTTGKKWLVPLVH